MKGVPLEVMLRFNRLKALTNEEATVAAALRKSASGLIEVTVFQCSDCHIHYCFVCFEYLLLVSLSYPVKFIR